MQTTLRTRRLRLGRRLSWAAVAALTTAALGFPSSTVLAGDKTEITICHATGSHENPYVVNSPAINSSGTDGGELAAGHNDHIGPIWFPGITVTWGDIIPPYDYEPLDFHYAGLNWTAEGQAIYENGCNIPTPQPTPNPTPEPTPVPTPEATPTGEVLAETGAPEVTLPPTDALTESTQTPAGDTWRLILLGMAGVLATTLLLTPTPARARRKDR